jgi:UDP-N-acetylmuramoyl-tripeptide--D-alanyl-D-alanine ligase
VIDLQNLIQLLPHTVVDPHARCAIRITFDSRQVDGQTAFAALAGEHEHGNLYISQALERGAPFILSDQVGVKRGVQVPDARAALRTWARSARDSYPAIVVGITGSAGKTTAKEYIGAALEGHYTPGNLNTLDAIACFLLEFATQVSEKPLVIEMGIDRVGEMLELMDLVAPDIGVITAIGEAHLEALGDLAGVAREKGGILQATRLALVSARASSYFPNIPSYGFETATFAGQNLQPTAAGAALTLEFAGVQVNVPSSSPIVAEAAVAALAIAQTLGLDLERAASSIAHVNVPGGRFRVQKHPWGVGEITIIDDTYNANPISMRAALEALSSFPQDPIQNANPRGRKIAVLGDMLELGPDSDLFHAQIKTFAQTHADLVLSTGAKAALLSQNPFPDHTALAQHLNLELQAGDVVLFKASRGIRLEGVIGMLLGSSG